MLTWPVAVLEIQKTHKLSTTPDPSSGFSVSPRAADPSSPRLNIPEARYHGIPSSPDLPARTFESVFLFGLLFAKFHKSFLLLHKSQVKRSD